MAERTETMSGRPTNGPANSSGGRPFVVAAGGFLLLIVLGVVFLLPKLHHRQELREEADTNSGPPPVVVVKLKLGNPDSEMEIPGSVQAFAQTPVFARTSGYVKARYVDIGDHVHQGQLLALIEDPTTEQSLRQAQASLVQLKAQLLQAQANAQLSTVNNDRWKQLYSQGVVAKTDADQRFADAGANDALVEAAKANIVAGEANVRNLEEQLSFSRVTAPFEGVILARNIDTGSLISSGSQSGVTQMFLLGQSNTVRVFTNVPQSAADSIRQARQTEVRFRELPGHSYTGIVARTSGSIDLATRTLLTEIDLKNADGRVLPGMYATVIFKVPTPQPPVMLPANALVVRTAGPQAVVLDGQNVAHFRAIVLGRDMGSETEVLSGLQQGDTVVLSPGDAVTEGTKVSPQVQH